MIDQFCDAQEWRRIDRFPAYEVSNSGQVRRCVAGHSSPAGKILKQQTLHGYRYVYLSRLGKVSACRVNRLVCAAFHGPPPNETDHAAHLNGIRDDNRPENLRWASAVENMADKEAHGSVPRGDRNGARLHPGRLARGERNGKYTKPERTPRGTAHGSARLCEEQVRAIRLDGRPQRQIAKSYGVSRGAIVSIVNGLTWRHVQ